MTRRIKKMSHICHNIHVKKVSLAVVLAKGGFHSHSINTLTKFVTFDGLRQFTCLGNVIKNTPMVKYAHSA